MKLKEVSLSILYIFVILIFLVLFDLLFQVFINNLLFELFDWFNALKIGWKIIILLLGGISVTGMLLWGVGLIGVIFNLYVFSYFPDNKFTKMSGILLTLINSILLLFTLWQTPTDFNFWIVLELLIISIFILSFSSVVRINRTNIFSSETRNKDFTIENVETLPEKSKNIRIFHASKYALYRTGVRTGLSKFHRIETIGEAVDGAQLLELLKYHVPDIILMDVSLPVKFGDEVLREIRFNYPHLKVIILTMHNDQSMINKMFELGANAYLTIDAGSDEIYEAIVQCFEKGSYTGSHLKKETPKNLNDNAWSLNEKEIFILRLLADKKSVQEIAAILDFSPRTVGALVEKLKRYAGTTDEGELIEIAKEKGLLS